MSAAQTTPLPTDAPPTAEPGFRWDIFRRLRIIGLALLAVEVLLLKVHSGQSSPLLFLLTFVWAPSALSFLFFSQPAAPWIFALAAVVQLLLYAYLFAAFTRSWRSIWDFLLVLHFGAALYLLYQSMQSD